MFLIQSLALNHAGEKDFLSWKAPQDQRERVAMNWIYKIATSTAKIYIGKTAYRSTSPTILISVVSLKGV